MYLESHPIRASNGSLYLSTVNIQTWSFWNASILKSLHEWYLYSRSYIISINAWWLGESVTATPHNSHLMEWGWKKVFFILFSGYKVILKCNDLDYHFGGSPFLLAAWVQVRWVENGKFYSFLRFSSYAIGLFFLKFEELIEVVGDYTLGIGCQLEFYGGESLGFLQNLFDKLLT